MAVVCKEARLWLARNEPAFVWVSASTFSCRNGQRITKLDKITVTAHPHTESGLLSFAATSPTPLALPQRRQNRPLTKIHPKDGQPIKAKAVL